MSGKGTGWDAKPTGHDLGLEKDEFGHWIADGPTRDKMRGKKPRGRPKDPYSLRSGDAGAFYVRFFHRKIGEYQRLSRQLAYIIDQCADKIAERAEIGMSVNVKGMGKLTIVLWQSPFSKRKVLVMGDPEEMDMSANCPGRGFYGEGVNSFFHYDDYMGSPAMSASKKEYIAFANHLPDIVTAFEEEQEAMIRTVLHAFDQLRHWAGSE